MWTPAVGGYIQPQNLAELLTVLDEFLRCRELPIAELAKFLESRGSVHPAFHANNLIDHLSFTAARIATTHGGKQSNSSDQ
ncbi:hypothetical protein AXA44_36510 [Rhodococcus sp. SC4]|nr:hypothetical protein AXA44_36510 [Rhodococcus sp. SC4]